MENKNLKIFFFINFILLFFFIIFIFFSKTLNFKYTYEFLIEYQISKINKIKSKEEKINLFFGDSSLGNSLSIKTLNNNSNLNNINLALDGTMSIGGSYALLSRIQAADLKKLNQAVFIFSPDVWSRQKKDSFFNLIYKYENKIIKNTYFLISSFNFRSTRFILEHYIKVFLNYFFKKTYKIDRAEYLNDDYIIQQNLKIKNNISDKFYNNFNKKKIFYLKKIDEFCFLNNINCIFTHAPILDAYCNEKKFKIYLSKIEREFENFKNISYLNDIACVPYSEIGDSYDHVNPNFKNKYSYFYLKLLNIK